MRAFDWRRGAASASAQTRLRQRRASLTANRDLGATMVTVLIVMMVLAIGGVVIAAIALNSTKLLAHSTDRVRAQAAADAGIAIQTVELMAGRLPCDPATPNAPGTGTVGDWADAISYTWTLDCSTPGTAVLRVRARVAAEESLHETVFGYELNASAPTNPYGGPAAAVTLFASDSVTFDSDIVFTRPGPDPLHVAVPRGAARCDTTVQGSFIAAGNIVVTPNCNVGGKLVSLGGAITGAHGRISGNVVASGLIELSDTWVGGTVASLGGTVTLSQDTRVFADIYARENVTLADKSRVAKNVYSSAGVLVMQSTQTRVGAAIQTGGTGRNELIGSIGGIIHTSGSIDLGATRRHLSGFIISGGDVHLGNTCRNGMLTVAAGKRVTKDTHGCYGSLNQPKSVAPPSVPVPDAPAAPEPWFGYRFAVQDWPGYAIRELQPTAAAGDSLSCASYGTGGTGWAAIAAFTEPTVIDARACDTMSTGLAGGSTVQLSHNLVILARQHDLSGATFAAQPSAGSGGEQVRLWIVSEDAAPVQDIPSCAATVGNIRLHNTTFANSLHTMLYTPCAVEFSGQSSMRGQIYGGDWHNDGRLALSYASIGLPGMAAPAHGGGELIDAGSWTVRSNKELPLP